MKSKQPLKRDSALVPLSREHHKGLILAQLLKSDAPDYKSLPSDNAGKVAFAKKTYEEILKGHFEKEESWLIPLSLKTGKLLASMASRILKEHAVIREKIDQLHDQSSSGCLDELGRLLAQHIRFEEREWFQELQAQASLKA